tara:strand:- start:397 stop:891 length:495 start_codon:yes stop_codon:yes gene_type:complete
MAKDKKFLDLLESYESRYNQNGFQVGDVFKFNDDFKSHDSYKALPDNVRAVIDSMIDSGLHTRVTSVKDSDDLVVASDHGGGRLVGKITLPCALGAPVDFGDNLPPLADVQRRDDKVNISPVELPELEPLSNSEGPVKKDEAEEDEEVVAESTEVKTPYTQQYL